MLAAPLAPGWGWRLEAGGWRCSHGGRDADPVLCVGEKLSTTHAYIICIILWALIVQSEGTVVRSAVAHAGSEVACARVT